MSILDPSQSAVVMIDHAVGFGNLFRSHELGTHINNAVALAKTAQTYDVPLVVTNGPDDAASGPLFPTLKQAIGDTEVVVRDGSFNAFNFPGFAEAVEATGRRTLLFSGLMTEGCVAQTAIAAVERGYEAYVVADAVAGETAETHDIALRRLAQESVRPITWPAVASEFQGSYANLETVQQFVGLMVGHSPALGMQVLAHQAAQSAVTAGAR